MEIATLHAYLVKSSGVCTDTRNIKRHSIFFALKGMRFDGNDYAEQAIQAGASYAVVDQSNFRGKPQMIVVKDALEALQKLATFHRKYLNLPLIAITGSNGKTTTKELIKRVLSKKYNILATQGNLNNSIGVPLTLLSMNENTEIGLVEMGANHRGEIKMLCEIAQPDFGYITNFGKAHLEGFGGIEGVIKGKSELYRSLQARGKTVFINLDDPIQVKQVQNENTVSFSEGAEADYQVTLLSAKPYVKMMAKNLKVQSKLLGTFHSKNIAAAICVGLYFDVSMEKIKEAIEAYLPDNNRSQLVKKGANEFILDAYNANPTSMKATLEHFINYPASKKVVILGDMFEIGAASAEEHQAIVHFLENNPLDSMLICGEAFFKTKTKKVRQFKTYEALKDFLINHPVSGATILIKASRGMALERLLDEVWQ